MTRTNHARAPKGADGTCRNRRRPQGERRPAWLRPFVRACRAISSSARLIGSTVLDVSASKDRVHRRPIRTSKNLLEASDRLAQASTQLNRATRELARINACIARDPENAADAPELLLETTESWVVVAEWLGEVVGDVFTFYKNVLDGLKDGTLVPERPAERRPRIVLAPRPVPIRAFLLLRQPRVIDRIASILRRRRRTPRPAAIHVPPDTHQGRAPPSSVCPF